MRVSVRFENVGALALSWEDEFALIGLEEFEADLRRSVRERVPLIRGQLNFEFSGPITAGPARALVGRWHITARRP